VSAEQARTFDGHIGSASGMISSTSVVQSSLRDACGYESGFRGIKSHGYLRVVANATIRRFLRIVTSPKFWAIFPLIADATQLHDFLLS
jgi:hypothetical protein